MRLFSRRSKPTIQVFLTDVYAEDPGTLVYEGVSQWAAESALSCAVDEAVGMEAGQEIEARIHQFRDGEIEHTETRLFSDSGALIA